MFRILGIYNFAFLLPYSALIARSHFPHATVCYHHGELCQIPLVKRIEDAFQLLPFINRMGHAICLGVAIQEQKQNLKLEWIGGAVIDEIFNGNGKIFQSRKETVKKGYGIDWSSASAVRRASLLFTTCLPGTRLGTETKIQIHRQLHIK